MNRLLSPESRIPLHVLTTPLDRIVIGRCEPLKYQENLYIRMIGPPDRAVNLHLAPPRDEGLVGEIWASRGPMIQKSSDVELFERNGRACFADVSTIIRQLGFERWRFTRAEYGPLCFGSRQWAYQIVDCLTSFDLFNFRAVGTESPLLALRDALFPRTLPQHTLSREAQSSRVEVVAEALGRLEWEWQIFVPWRTRVEEKMMILEGYEVKTSKKNVDATQKSRIGSETESPLTIQMMRSIEAVRAMHSPESDDSLGRVIAILHNQILRCKDATPP